MGLRIGGGPSWEEDSFGYVASDVAELGILNRSGALSDRFVSDDFYFDSGKDRDKYDVRG